MAKDDGKLKAKVQELKQKVVDMERNFENKVSEHPVQSVSIAFGAGLVIGALMTALSRRR